MWIDLLTIYIIPCYLVAPLVIKICEYIPSFWGDIGRAFTNFAGQEILLCKQSGSVAVLRV